MKEELRHELVRLTYSPEIVSFELTREQGLEILQEIKRLNNIINELEEYIKSFLYMLNGITDRDVYEQCQLDDFGMIMDKLQELKGSDKE